MTHNHNTYVAIMAGGVGSRFWPASREAKPKQFLDILGVGKSLIRMTFERFLKLCPAEHIFVVTNKQYAKLVKEHLPELTDNQILTEPSRNNTGPCVAYTAFKLQALNPEANLVVAPSDHIILKEDEFINTLKTGLAFTAEHDALLTLGIRPTRPDTGYGYIEVGPPSPEATADERNRKSEATAGSPVPTKEVGIGSDRRESRTDEGGRDGKPEATVGSPVPTKEVGMESDRGARDGEPPNPKSQIHPVRSFREKPDKATAQQYLQSGNYLWNAGIFVWRVEAVLKAFQEHATKIHTVLAIGAPKYNTEEEQAFIDEAYPTTPSISVDYAIMEQADNVYTIPSDFGWSDLGTWASLHAESPKDEHGNAIQGDKVMAYGLKDSLVRAPKDKLVAIAGLENYIIVDEGDVLLIWPKYREQEIKEIKEITKKIGEERYL